MRYIRLVELVLVLVLLCVSATASGSSASGTYPAEPFNGMQIDYSVSGASIINSTDSPGFTTARTLQGTLGSGELRVSGTARMGSGYSADLTVKAWAGDKENNFSANIPSGSPGFNESTFDVAVPIPQGVTSGGFSIDMDGHYNAGDRGLIVSGDLQPPAVSNQTVVNNPPTPNPPNQSSPAVPVPCKEAAYFYKDGEMAKIYSGTGDPLSYNRDQLVNMMISAMEDYKKDGGNAYASAINAKDSKWMAYAFISSALPTGNEADLKKKVKAYYETKGRLLTPEDLFYLALKTCRGDVREALVTAHAVLYRGDSTNAQLIKDYLVPLRNPAAYNSVDRFIPSKTEKDENGKPKLLTPRDVLSNDQQGVWYHLFGMAALEFQDEANVVPWVPLRLMIEEAADSPQLSDYANKIYPIPNSVLPAIKKLEGWKNPSEIGTVFSNYALALENIIRSNGGSPADPDKQCINYAGIAIGEALRKYLGMQALDLGLSEPGQTIAGEPQSLNPSAISLNPSFTILMESPVSLKIEGKNGEVFFFDQAKKQFSGNTPLVILDPLVEDDDTIGLLATPLFEVKNVEIQAVKEGAVTIGVYSYGDGKTAVRSIDVKLGDSYTIDLTQFIGPDQQPQIILTPVNTPATKTGAEETTKSIEIFNSWNIAAVDNSPSCNPSFTISQPHYITYLDTYHWNYGKGTAAGGTIGLRSVVGTEYGPWQTETKSGQDGVPNAWWIAHPNETIPAGTYTIMDSDSSTWSQNSESNGCGFSKVEGYPIQSDGTTSLAPISAAVTQSVSSSGEEVLGRNTVATGQQGSAQGQPSGMTPITEVNKSNNNPEKNVQGGCHKDPVTGQMICIDTIGDLTGNMGAHVTFKPGSIWKVKEYGSMGNWDGEWVIREDGQTIDASWSGGSITDIIDIKLIEGDQITLYRHGNKGYYTGTISPDGLSMSGTASWYSPGETWTASTT